MHLMAEIVERIDINVIMVGLICAHYMEMAALSVMRDVVYEVIQQQDSHDSNHYTFGRIAGHKVVIAYLPSGDNGTTSAATVANQMLRSFKSIKLALLVGIGSAIPDKYDIRQGDVVVSQPEGPFGGVYNMTKEREHLKENLNEQGR